ncbi:activating signal cointegrator 1-like isoform X2 [Lineus longissimus]|uniref:activating signal cointegrator 1-like isoform X2 n=1 Tax=Lineus longissimus TaxID=88925 RepID=UPI002B4D888A
MDEKLLEQINYAHSESEHVRKSSLYSSYILAIGNKQDLEEYMCELLDGTKPRNRRFIDELLRRWKARSRPIDGHVPDNFTAYNKKTDQEVLFHHNPDKSKSKKKSKGHSVRQEDQGVGINGVGVNSTSVDEPPLKDTSNKKKQKYVALYSKEGQDTAIVKLPGRHICQCQASKHRLVGNCMKCGRIVCDQEGSGPCVFCSTLVCNKEEQEILARGSKKSERLRQDLMRKGMTDENGAIMKQDRHLLPHASAKLKSGFDRAVEQKERLLEYDRTSVRRTQVIDDESDYFTTDGNQWLNKDERKKLKQREEELRSVRHGSRRDRKITFDFAGRRVIDAEDSGANMYDKEDSVVQEVFYGVKPKNDTNAFRPEDFGDLVNPGIVQEPPQFVETGLKQPFSKAVSQGSSSSSAVSNERKNLRIQDRQLQEMSDEGMCMSMHQPWASLLVAGIKKHEGRTWYTSHRGRLWIAATAKTPLQTDIDQVENQYRAIYKNRSINFPDHYPVGCLLGCVEVSDCLAQEDYDKQFPHGESASPFVFICQDPHELVVKFPMKGKHKLYKLESHFHQAAKKGARRVDSPF